MKNKIQKLKFAKLSEEKILEFVNSSDVKYLITHNLEEEIKIWHYWPNCIWLALNSSNQAVYLTEFNASLARVAKNTPQMQWLDSRELSHKWRKFVYNNQPTKKLKQKYKELFLAEMAEDSFGTNV